MSEAAVERNEFPDPYEIPLEDINMAQGGLFQQQLHWRYFERLRAKIPSTTAGRVKSDPSGPLPASTTSLPSTTTTKPSRRKGGSRSVHRST